MKNTKFSMEEIRKGIDLLIWKTSRMGLHAHTIDPYFDGFSITLKTLPLSLLLTEFIGHLHGQLHRLFFDSSKNFKTASIKSIYNQIIYLIENDKFAEFKGVRHQALFDTIQEILTEVVKHENKLRLYTDKYYAHSEIRLEEEAKLDYEKYKISWLEIKNLIQQAKKILNIMYLYTDDCETDFAEGEYEVNQIAFWKLIDKSVFNKSGK